MPAQDMLDVVHYYFETDTLTDKEMSDAKVKMRQTIYSQLYERPYTWGNVGVGADREFGTQEVSSSGGERLTHKPYVPPTPVNANSARPYGGVLDAPLG